MLDEIEEPLVRPVEVLEDHDRGAALRDALEECAPGGKGLLILSGGRVFDAEQGGEVRREPASLAFVRDILNDGGLEPLPGDLGIVGLGDASATTKHLAQSPEGHALAIGR